MTIKYPFTRPSIVKDCQKHVVKALDSDTLAGHGIYNEKCSQILNQIHRDSRNLITPSGTAAIELAALLCDFKAGDEIIMPSFTFVSTANPFVLRGCIPVFVDIEPCTLNIDPDKIISAISNKTAAIVVVHYAGVPCNMDKIMAIANSYNLLVIEDNAQGLGSSLRDRPLGTFGSLSACSFHSTKNITAGEGGCLTINEDKLVDRAEIIREKGTNRTKFVNGEIDKYTWCDLGSSYLLGELSAALLYSQLLNLEYITNERLKLWNYYFDTLSGEKIPQLALPCIPIDYQHNGHIFYIVLGKNVLRSKLIEQLKSFGIQATSHYVPLHTSKFGAKIGRSVGSMNTTNFISEQILRLPLWLGMSKNDVQLICEKLMQLIIDATKV